MRSLLLALSALCAVLLATITPVAAHSPSSAYLTLSVSEGRIDGRWDIALRDLELAVGLDRDRDAEITWDEVSAQEEAISAYALARLSLASGSRICVPRATDLLIERHGDGGYAVLEFSADCPVAVRDLTVGYNLLFELDPLHRGLFQIEQDGVTKTAVFSPNQQSWQSDESKPGAWRQITTYFAEGVWHIWIGFDHILFLLSLLLPSVMRREGTAWRPVPELRQAFLEVVKVVTAFTLAHSVTLALSTLGWLSLPPALVEPVIAGSIVLAALNNITPLVTRGLWAVAFVFGLIHGVGFAGALQDLGLPSDALLLSLLSFNLGVEAGQLVIVAAFLPLAFALRQRALYPSLVLRFGSLLIATVAALWLIERSLGLELIT